MRDALEDGVGVIWYGDRIMGVKSRFDELNLVVGGFVKSLKIVRDSEPNYPIDFIVTWVDDNDPCLAAGKCGNIG